MPLPQFFSAVSRVRFTPAVILLYLFVVLSLLSLWADRVSPASFWPAGFLATLAPVLYLGNGLLLLALLLGRSVHAVAVLVVLLVGLPLLSKTYRGSADPVAASSAETFRVLSYNISFFSVPRVFSDAYRDPTYNLTVDNAINWLQSGKADVYCLQEFFDDSDSDIYNTAETLTDSGAYEHHFVYKDQVKNKTRRGLMILSSFPIVNRGEVFVSDNYFNGAIYADVRVNQDTVRIINVHLESMQLSSRQRSPLSVVGAYRQGLAAHSRQVDQLVAFVQQSPYPTVLAGDLNETPYGYVYRRLGQVMNSAFETAGEGFGFTYQGERLSFLRIDHQFYTGGLRAVQYFTHHGVPFSKHLPVEVSYAY